MLSKQFQRNALGKAVSIPEKDVIFFFFWTHMSYNLQQKALTTAVPKGGHPENQDSNEPRHLRTII